MLSLKTVLPTVVSNTIIERFFITEAEIPEGQVWENKILPSIMQSVVIDLGSHPPVAKYPDGREFACPGDLILGQFTHSCTSVLHGYTQYIGIHFTPTGLHRVLGADMSSFANNILPLPRFINWHKALRDSLKTSQNVLEIILIIEHFIQENLQAPPVYYDAITKAAGLICKSKGTITVNQLCKSCGMSERSLQRYFKVYTGVSPKAFAQVARFNAVTKLIDEVDTPSWPDIFDETGYFDLAHFVNDFKRITGKTPLAYFKGKTQYEKFFNAYSQSDVGGFLQ